MSHNYHMNDSFGARHEHSKLNEMEGANKRMMFLSTMDESCHSCEYVWHMNDLFVSCHEHSKLNEMEAANKKLMFLATMPYKTGVSIAVISAVGALPMVCVMYVPVGDI